MIKAESSSAVRKGIQLEQVVVHFKVSDGVVRAVDGIDAFFPEGEITGLIGESGCGKSVLGMALLGLLPTYANVSGAIWLDGENLFSLNAKQMRKLRGRKIGLIPQNPADSFNAVRKIGGQIREAQLVRDFASKENTENRENIKNIKDIEDIESTTGIESANHTKSTRKIEKSRIREWLERFGFSSANSKRVEKSYPFELSGGMLQRAAAAMGTASKPEWVIADEPSKGLDESNREQLYQTLALVQEQGTKGMLIITHDLELARTLCTNLAVMYSGQIVEMGKGILDNPKHPYTQGLLRSLPSRGMHPMEGSAPAPWESLQGCKFAPRCPWAEEKCFKEQPKAFLTEGRSVRCYRYA